MQQNLVRQMNGLIIKRKPMSSYRPLSEPHSALRVLISSSLAITTVFHTTNSCHCYGCFSGSLWWLRWRPWCACWCRFCFVSTALSGESTVADFFCVRRMISTFVLFRTTWFFLVITLSLSTILHLTLVFTTEITMHPLAIKEHALPQVCCCPIHSGKPPPSTHGYLPISLWCHAPSRYPLSTFQ